MADETPEEKAAAKAASDLKTAHEEESSELEKAQAEVEKWKAMSRKHEGQAKENSEAANKLKAAEDAKKTAEELAAERLSALEDRLAQADSRAMRAEVAASKGLTPSQAKRLQGATLEELEADADDLLESFKPADKADDESDTDTKKGRPRESLRGGASSSDDGGPEESDPAKLAALVPRGIN